MTKKYKVKTAAVFNGQPVGSIIDLNEKTALKYEALKYLEIIDEVKSKPKKSQSKKSTSATKKTAKKSAKKSDKKKSSKK